MISKTQIYTDFRTRKEPWLATQLSLCGVIAWTVPAERMDIRGKGVVFVALGAYQMLGGNIAKKAQTLPPRLDERGARCIGHKIALNYDNSSRSALAPCKSGVSNPSVNQL
jgi:hypothetical protein